MSLPHPEALAAASRDLLRRLGERPWADDVYLAGSGALTLHLGHRPVRDLDFMSATNRLRPPARRDLLGDLLRIDRDLRVETARDGFLHVRSGEGVGIRFYYYPYPLVESEELLGRLPVASLLDLVLMKLAAIISRGAKRDFCDLFLACRRQPLAAALERAPDKFGHVRDFALQALKGLADLSLTTGEPAPTFAEPLEWSEVVTWVETQVRELGRELAGLPLDPREDDG